MSSEWTWLRPHWLWAFLPLCMAALWWAKQSRRSSGWEQAVDEQLQHYVIEAGGKTSALLAWLVFLFWSLAILLLAGPVWEQQEVQVFKAEQAEVIVFDLSQSMNADDLPPNRLTRARFKLVDLLNRSEGHQTALVVFAERPYVISPLTEDVQTIESFVPSLSTDLVPVQGSRLDLAIELSGDLLQQAGIAQGHILVISDAEIEERDLLAAERINEQGHRLSILAVATAQGTPLRDANGQFVQKANGAIVVPRLDMTGINALASNGGGIAAVLTGTNEDLTKLASVRRAIAINDDKQDAKVMEMFWVEYAPIGVWVLLIGMILGFRKGLLL